MRVLHPGLLLRQPLFCCGGGRAGERQAGAGEQGVGEGRGSDTSSLPILIESVLPTVSPVSESILGRGLCSEHRGDLYPTDEVRVRGRAPCPLCRVGARARVRWARCCPHAISHSQLRPGAGLSVAVAAKPAAQVLQQPGIRLAAFPGRPVLEPWGPPSPCLPRCPGPGTADLCYRRRPLHAPLPASADRDPG